MKKLALHWQIIIALILAVIFGLYGDDYIEYIKWIGVLFLRALKMVMVPLILSSIASGMVNIGNGQALGQMGFKTIIYYLSTSMLSIIVGLTLVNIIQPGVGADLGFAQSVSGLSVTDSPFIQTLYNIIPTNIFKAFADGDMLAIIFFALLAGFFITKLPTQYNAFMVKTINASFELMMLITNFIIQFTPLGVFSLVAVTVAEQAGDTAALITIAQRLGLYGLTVILGLAVHFAISLPLLLKLVGKVKPLNQFNAMSVPLLTAFSTSSSAATLPLTITAVEKAGVSNKVTSFVLPLGATINMDGTALYECVAVMFIAQAYGVDLAFGEQLIVVFTALLASIGAAGIPMAGLVMMSVVLSAVGLPLEGIGMILAVDRILDMMRTTVNVWSDSCGAVIISKLEGEQLKL